MSERRLNSDLICLYLIWRWLILTNVSKPFNSGVKQLFFLSWMEGFMEGLMEGPFSKVPSLRLSSEWIVTHLFSHVSIFSSAAGGETKQQKVKLIPSALAGPSGV